MAKSNPFVGGPDYVRALGILLEQRPNAFSMAAPSAAGSQVSIRLLQDRLELLDILSEKSGWNRNQLIVALLDKGLCVLFEQLPDEVAGKIIKERVARVSRHSGIRRIKQD